MVVPGGTQLFKQQHMEIKTSVHQNLLSYIPNLYGIPRLFKIQVSLNEDDFLIYVIVICISNITKQTKLHKHMCIYIKRSIEIAANFTYRVIDGLSLVSIPGTRINHFWNDARLSVDGSLQDRLGRNKLYLLFSS